MAAIEISALDRTVQIMSQKNSTPEDPRAKQALFQGETRSRINPRILLAVAVIILAVAGSTYIYGIQSETAVPAPPAPGTAMAADQRQTNGDVTQISYPLSLFEDGKARHFEYQTDERAIRFFMLKSADGIIRAAFDACDVCWPAGKGYVQAGDAMICTHCSRRFPVSRINHDQGGCNPAPLKRTVKDDQVVIQVHDLLQGERYFNFEQKG
jgi:uncharacterized membrane protein